MLDKRIEDRIRQDSKDWKYSHRDRNTAGGCVKLLNRFEIKCNDANIGHILEHSRIQCRRSCINSSMMKPSQNRLQTRANVCFKIRGHTTTTKAIKTIKMQEQAKLTANFDTAITTLYSLLDNVIVEALDVKKAEVRRQTSLERNSRISTGRTPVLMPSSYGRF